MVFLKNTTTNFLKKKIITNTVLQQIITDISLKRSASKCFNDIIPVITTI